eukprot:Seg154.2 transcript_id=Seg154.2/GoldUCD/mRNA.D3Y31 product="hypothetical protein" protein_id=Seg154.2/GoldUCD/D3Y31
MKRQGVKKNPALWRKEDADAAMPLDVFVKGVGGPASAEPPKSHESISRAKIDSASINASAPKRKADRDVVLNDDPTDGRVKTERDQPQHDARFPLLKKEVSTLSQRAKLKKVVTKKAEKEHLGKKETAGEQPDTKFSASRGMMDSNLPKVNNDRFSARQRYQDSREKLQTMGPAIGSQSQGNVELPPVNPPLVPFGKSEASSQGDKNGDRKAGLSRKGSSPLPKSDSKVTRRVSKQNEKENRRSITDGVKEKTFTRSSVSPKSPPRLSSDQKLLQDEAYCMENLRFTTNFTFSFFDTPPAYKTQANMLRSSVNTLGERGRPKFSQRPPKSPKKPKQESDKGSKVFL